MKFDEIRHHVEGIPYLSSQDGRVLYDFIVEKKPAECLELGFAHGVSVCYVAAALDELGAGHITAVDLNRGMEWQKPSIEYLLNKTGLGNYVTVARESLSYTWFLKKKIEECTAGHTCSPIYEFCYIDGPKNWTNDGCAFFLVDKLLKPNGYILFDDFSWTYADADEWSIRKLEEAGILVGEMEKDESETPHVELIFKLLVMQHPDYAEFVVQNENWAWAQKTGCQSQKTVVTKEVFNISNRLRRLFRRLNGRC